MPLYIQVEKDMNLKYFKLSLEIFNFLQTVEYDNDSLPCHILQNDKFIEQIKEEQVSAKYPKYEIDFSVFCNLKIGKEAT